MRFRQKRDVHRYSRKRIPQALSGKLSAGPAHRLFSAGSGVRLELLRRPGSRQPNACSRTKRDTEPILCIYGLRRDDNPQRGRRLGSSSRRLQQFN